MTLSNARDWERASVQKALSPEPDPRIKGDEHLTNKNPWNTVHPPPQTGVGPRLGDRGLVCGLENGISPRGEGTRRPVWIRTVPHRGLGRPC